jgi:hypothetical protein
MSMPCSEILPLVQPYIDGELIERPLHDFEGHVAACADCGQSLRVEEAFCRRVRSCLHPFSAPEPLRRRVGLALDAEDAARARASRRVRLGRLVSVVIGAGAAAAIALAAECGGGGRDDGASHSSRAAPASDELYPVCASTVFVDAEGGGEAR